MLLHCLLHVECNCFSNTPGLTRAVYASLHSAGFPPILDRKGSAAEVVDPSDVANVDPYLEERDRLKVNEIILQFMAFSRYL
jgi:nephrocystin-4